MALGSCLPSAPTDPDVRASRIRLLRSWGCCATEPADALGAIFSVSSLNGRMFISLSSCPEMVPEPEFLADCIRASIAEMGGGEPRRG